MSKIDDRAHRGNIKGRYPNGNERSDGKVSV